jgi:uncharacterized membrane protein
LQSTESAASLKRPIPMSFILMAAFLVHVPLLMMKLPLRSYDTNFHIFFASHYLHHWFDPWNAKWYAGFSQTTYPPLPHQWIAVVSHLLGLDMAYMAVQFVSILLLAVGVYRFARLWVSERAASYASLASVFLGSESFLVYTAGQLSTTTAAPIYLNALPYLYEWVRHGSWRAFLKGSVLFACAAAAHHATLLFGSMFFALPVLALALLDREEGPQVSRQAFVFRTVAIGLVVGAAITAVLLPFWIALIHNPVTQTPIPHASRANYILSPQWGMNYFIVPYGAIILALPFIVLRGSVTPRLRPLLIGFWVCALVGVGGTTPVASWVLQRAFEVLTMERFSYWATLLSLPFVGLLAVELTDRYRRAGVVILAVVSAFSCGLAAAWITYHPADASDFKVESVAAWLNRDGHDRYRYITLGFGNRIPRLALETDASSLDGEWNSGRTLPELTQNGGAALTNTKYFGKPGLDALRAILFHADHYGLKWVFVRDPYYDPLLSFAGFRRVDSLEDRTIAVWSKEGAPPATPLNSNLIPPHWQGLLWGTLPFGSSLLALLVAFIPDRRWRRESSEQRAEQETVAPEMTPAMSTGRLVI